MPLLDTLLTRIEEAAGTLPEGWEIHIEVERGCALVRLHRPNGTAQIIDTDETNISDLFREAVDLADVEAREAHGSVEALKRAAAPQ